jgi:hypothetical protein
VELAGVLELVALAVPTVGVEPAEIELAPPAVAAPVDDAVLLSMVVAFVTSLGVAPPTLITVAIPPVDFGRVLIGAVLVAGFGRVVEIAVEADVSPRTRAAGAVGGPDAGTTTAGGAASVAGTIGGAVGGGGITGPRFGATATTCL